MRTKLFAIVCLVVLTAGCATQTSTAPALPPTTQQSLQNAQTALTVETLLYTAGKAYAEKQIAAGKISNPTAVAAIRSAESAIEAQLAAYQADINAGNLTALTADKANVGGAIESILLQVAAAVVPGI